MIVYFNNCKRRDHARKFGSGAFYDLNTVGFQATKANNLSVGQQCVVATPANDGQIIFKSYSFLRETVMLDDDDKTSYRVFFGKLINLIRAQKGMPLVKDFILRSLLRTETLRGNLLFRGKNNF
jgi:hypothetical protein